MASVITLGDKIEKEQIRLSDRGILMGVSKMASDLRIILFGAITISFLIMFH